MTTRTGRKARSTGLAYGLKTLIAEGPGVFEAIVSVFGNVDYANDRVLFGAFTGSLERWKSSGDPIPVIFAHQWDDLDAHIGEVLEAEELPPGDDRLPPELMANGGLWTKFRLDVDEDYAGRVGKRLERRSLREFSFAYDVIVERRSADGANDLVELDLIEVGPCLKGMNPATSLLARARKALGSEADGLTDEEVLDHVSIEAKSASPVTFAGSLEERQAALMEAVYGWASDGDVGNGGFYALHLDATFDERAVVVVEGWSDPMGTGIPHEVAYSFADGVATIEEPYEVVVEATTRSKGRRSAWKAEGGTMVSDQPKTDKAKAKSDTLEEPEVEDQVEGDDPGADPALVELAIADLELEDEGEAPSDT